MTYTNYEQYLTQKGLLPRQWAKDLKTCIAIELILSIIDVEMSGTDTGMPSKYNPIRSETEKKLLTAAKYFSKGDFEKGERLLEDHLKPHVPLITEYVTERMRS